MSWRYGADDLDRRIARALVVQEHGRDDVDALDYIADRSRADPSQVGGDA
jgi:hypothetical protein